MAGRPTKYQPSYTTLAYNYCLLGADDKFLARSFEVNIDTIHEWKKKHREFSDAIKRGKEIADGQVAAALFKRAVGYEYEEDTLELVQKKKLELDEEGNIRDKNVHRLVVTKRIIKQVAPDPLAAFFWLKNRQPELWRDKPEGKQPEDEKPKPLWLTSNNLDEIADGPNE